MYYVFLKCTNHPEKYSSKSKLDKKNQNLINLKSKNEND